MLNSLRKFLKRIRRKRNLATRPTVTYRRMSNPEIGRHIAMVKADQRYGVLLGDGVTTASIENSWVRKELRSQGKLCRNHSA